MVDLIEYQRAQAAVAAPVGGGAGAARARGGGARGGASSAASAPSMAEASSRRGGVAAQQQTISGAAADDGSKKAARLSMRSKAAAAERVNSMQIRLAVTSSSFPSTQPLPSWHSGREEGTIVSEIRAQLQTETSRHHHQQDRDECEEAEGEEPGMATNEAAHGGGGGRWRRRRRQRVWRQLRRRASSCKGRPAAAALAHPRVAKGVHRGNGKGMPATHSRRCVVAHGRLRLASNLQVKAVCWAPARPLQQVEMQVVRAAGRVPIRQRRGWALEGAQACSGARRRGIPLSTVAVSAAGSRISSISVARRFLQRIVLSAPFVAPSSS